MSELGPCCTCGITGGAVVNILMLDRQAPEGYMGWGCEVCELPPRGAVAVLCDICLRKPVTHCCGGKYPADGVRVALVDFPNIPFEHDMRRHRDEVS